MKSAYPLYVEVSLKYRPYAKQEKKLFKRGFTRDTSKTERFVYSATVTNWLSFLKVKRFCCKNRFYFTERSQYVDKNFAIRSNSYRSNFFKEYPPLSNGKYRCVYCGKSLGKSDTTVDHLYPVRIAKKSIHYQKKLKKMGIDNINSIKNLVPACKKCNSKKSAKLGFWIVRGKLGQHKEFWQIVFVLKVLLIVGAITLIITSVKIISNMY